MTGGAVVAFLEAVCEGLPFEECPRGRGEQGMVVDPARFGEEGVFVYRLTGICSLSCGGGGIVTKLSCEGYRWGRRGVEVYEYESLRGDISMYFEKRVFRRSKV